MRQLRLFITNISELSTRKFRCVSAVFLHMTKRLQNAREFFGFLSNAISRVSWQELKELGLMCLPFRATDATPRGSHHNF